MVLSVDEILANAPKILSKLKGGAIKALDVIDDCIDGAKSFLKDAKKMEIPSMEDIVACFNRLTNNNQFQPALEGVNYSKYVDDVEDVKGVRVDKVEGDDTKGESNFGRLVPGNAGVVTGGNSTKLGQNIFEDMELPRTTGRTPYQAMHIIPKGLRSHPV